jgi:hypothetical protein
MQFVMVVSLLSVIAIAPVQHAPTAHSAAPRGRYFVALMPQHKAGARVGVAIISPHEHGGTVVELRAATLAATPVQAQIVHGNCSSPQPPVAFTLSPLHGGYSATTLPGMKVHTLVSGRYAIIVESDPPACGELRLLPNSR